MKEIKNKISHRLKLLRIKKGLTISQLALKIGVSESTIWRWENKKSDVKRRHLVLLVKYFDVSADYLLGLKNKKYNCNKQIKNKNQQKFNSNITSVFFL